jgi:hypothetical protein
LKQSNNNGNNGNYNISNKVKFNISNVSTLMNPTNDPLFQSIIAENNNETASHRLQQQIRRVDDSEAVNGKGESKEVGLVKEVVDPENSPVSKEFTNTLTGE